MELFLLVVFEKPMVSFNTGEILPEFQLYKETVSKELAFFILDF